MKYFLILIPALCLGGCFIPISYSTMSKQGYNDAVGSWMGRPITEVVAAWGKPTKIKAGKDDEQHYIWFRTDEYKEPGMVYSDGKGGIEEYPGEQYSISCTTTLRVNNSSGNVIGTIPDSFDNDCGRMVPPPTRRIPADKNNTTNQHH
ncbi:hypothetical protein LJB99_04645 [Deltaproteobacteria bacterium OttesenSCG-928-K17]|nr:hypothetical protein [Deltaproteobacteria bacterium OttesenSCG-928-K17]